VTEIDMVGWSCRVRNPDVLGAGSKPYPNSENEFADSYWNAERTREEAVAGKWRDVVVLVGTGASCSVSLVLEGMLL